MGDWSFLWEESSYASHAPYSHHSLDDFLTIRLYRCLTLGKVKKYSCVVRAFQPMLPVVPLEDTIVVLCQLHPFSLNHVPPLIFYYQLKHTFVIDRTLFAHALTIAPHLSSGGLYGMVYEHISGCLIPKDPSLGFSKLF